MDGLRRRALVPAVAALTGPRASRGNLLISSFNPFAVLVHRALAPRVASAWLVESELGLLLPLLARAGSVALHPKHTLIDAARLAAWKKRHVSRVHTWTVNDPERARELAALGVDCLITDNPGLLRSALEEARNPRRVSTQENAVPSTR
jgi:glycerophosphoryl diester phosphodiesterase